MTKTILVPVEPTEEMWGGLARDIVFWMKSLGSARGTGVSLHNFLRNIRGPAPDWLTKEIPDTDVVPPKGTIAACIYKAMLESAPKPTIPEDDREEVARAMRRAGVDNMLNGDEDPENVKTWKAMDPDPEDFTLADAAISTLQGLGWGKK